MDEKYDVIVLGTGLKECILSGLMSSVGNKKVLHLDRNPYYGGESASLNLEQLWARFAPGEDIPKDLGKSREYAIDLCPKFLMACGKLVKILLKTKVTAYLEFRSVAGSYVYQKDKKDKGAIYKIPTKPNDAITSKLLNLKQKNKYRSMLQFIANYDPNNEKTHKKDLDLTETTSQGLYDHYKLESKSILFNGHAVALYRDDSYLEKNCQELVSRCQMYANSVARYGSSPYIYPRYGLGGLPEGFSRRSAVHGGVYMLNCDKKENFVEKIVTGDDGKISVTVGGETAPCEFLIGDPSYFKGTDAVKEIGKVVRCICILDHPIPETSNQDSCQIIIPGAECNRESDIYICMSSFKHNIAADGFYIAVCSATVEIPKGQEYDEKKYDYKKDLGVAIDLLGEVKQIFHWVSICHDKAKDYPSGPGTYITSSYDATTHFENCCKEVLDIYEQIMGEPLDLEMDEKEEIENEKIQ